MADRNLGFQLDRLAHVAYDAAAKKRFHRDAKTLLRRVVKVLGLRPAEYELRSNEGGVAVSGEIILHTERLYVQISQAWGLNLPLVMYRACNGRDDYTGRANRWCAAGDLDCIPQGRHRLVRHALWAMNCIQQGDLDE